MTTDITTVDMTTTTTTDIIVTDDAKMMAEHINNAIQVSGSGYLPRVQLMTSGSELCKSGVFPINHYALVSGSDDYFDLGATMDCYIVTARAKAISFGDGVVTAYNPKSADFIDIQRRSREKDSGCMWGPEYLIWLPGEQTLATLFLGGASSRREGALVNKYLGKYMTLSAKAVESKEYKWYSIKVSPCTATHEPPSEKEIAELRAGFYSPVTSETTEVATTQLRDR